MVKIEKEFKVLNIDIEGVRKKLKEIGVTFIDKKIKKYMYMMYLHCIIDI